MTRTPEQEQRPREPSTVGERPVQRWPFVTAARVDDQRVDGAVMDGNVAGLAELGLADVEQPGVQVDVVEMVPQRFSDAEPGHREQPTSVSKVAARNGDRSRRAARMSAAMSSSEYRYGTARWLRDGSNPAGGT